ncbi:MAG: DUF4351 domain-containing protein [Natronospirillum sp.]
MAKTSDFTWTHTWEQQGIQKGRLEGRLEGEAMLLKKQLTRRFGELPADMEQRLTNATSEELEAWAENILDAQTLDEVFSRN